MRAGAVVLLLFAACGGDDVSDTSTDAAVDTAPDAPAVTVSAPEAPMPPTFTPCPDGWYEIEEDGIAVCEPWPETGRATCAEHEAHFPGRPGCERIGTECPAGGGFPADLPAGAPVIYVREGSAGGDGTEGAPFASVAEAVAGAAPGTVVAIAMGTYDETIELPEGVHLLGACAESTHLVSTTVTAPDPVVRIIGADTRIENLTIGPADGLGVRADGAGLSVVVRDVIVRDATSVAMLIDNEASLDAERIVLRRTSPIAGGYFGRGLDIEDDAVADVRWLASEDNHEWGALSLRGQLTVSDAVSLRTRPNDFGGGPGFGAVDGEMTARRIVSEENTEVGLIGVMGSTQLEVEDCVIRDTTRNLENDFGGRGIVVQEDATAILRRCRVQHSKEIALMLSASEATFEDLMVTDVETRASDDQVGRAISVRDEANVTLTRFLIRRARSEGILVVGASTLIAHDGDVRDIRPVSDFFGRAMVVGQRSTIDMARWEVADLTETAFLFVDLGTTVTVRDLFVHDVDSRPLDGALGRGINVQLGASMTGERVAIQNVKDVGLAVLSPNTRVDLSDIYIGPVASVDCAESSCSDDPRGHGMGVYEEGDVHLSRFEIADAELCGLHVAAQARARIEEGTVRGSTIGACIQSEAQDLADLTRAVHYVDNGDGLVSTSLPVPMPLEESESM